MVNRLPGRGNLLLTALVLVLIFFGALTLQAQSSEGASLEGEFFVAGDPLPGDIGFSFTLCQCDEATGSGFATFTAGGLATTDPSGPPAPFPGTFFETGTVGRTSEGTFFFESTFEIRDELTGALIAEGRKTFDGLGASVFNCSNVGQEFLLFGADVQYTATIHAAGGGQDRGRALPGGSGFQIGMALETGFFEETFDSHEHVTGGGRILDSTFDTVSFGFIARKTSKGPRGHCNVIDHRENKHIKCLDVMMFTQEGTHATFIGNATVNGVPTTYRIDVEDLGEPGRDRDMFSIQAGTYFAGGRLTQGNIQFH